MSRVCLRGVVGSGTVVECWNCFEYSLESLEPSSDVFELPAIVWFGSTVYVKL